MIHDFKKCFNSYTEHEMGHVYNLLLILLTIVNFCWNLLILKLFDCINIQPDSFELAALSTWTVDELVSYSSHLFSLIQK